ncbi:MAG: bifunctional folylpolyglutamate synthase/dihydrofolate synthase [Acidobacteriales bacterium]|nr:bifunctional folylpolyglutamate synthase/dihydrofolate synthase [Terriglobales bacterium]
MSYQSAVERMYALGHELAGTPSHKFDLAHMRTLLQALESPEQRFPSVLIAGTNGKGSTAATLAAILQTSRLRTGLYTSPHLVRINERIQVSGEQISDDDFVLVHDLVERTAERLVAEGDLPWHPSFFEMLTAMAFEHFSRRKVDIAVLEVGMGGRLDATNVVEPLLSVITDISLDHEKFLGTTVAQIAREKSGILRAGKPAVVLPQQPEANDVIGHAILDLGAIGVNAAAYVPPVSPAAEPQLAQRMVGGGTQFVSRYPLAVMGKEIQVETPLLGRHQLRNVALAIAAADELRKQDFPIHADSVERGIRETHWPGRFQVVARAGQPDIVLDVAHNPAGAWALRSTLSAAYPEVPLTLVFGAMRDKALASMTEILFPLAERVVLTKADNPRSATPDEIRAAAQRTAADMEDLTEVERALARARELARPGEIIVVTGSIYVVGEALRLLAAAA